MMEEMWLIVKKHDYQPEKDSQTITLPGGEGGPAVVGTEALGT